MDQLSYVARCMVCGVVIRVDGTGPHVEVELDQRNEIHVLHEHADQSEFEFKWESETHDEHEGVE